MRNILQIHLGVNTYVHLYIYTYIYIAWFFKAHSPMQSTIIVADGCHVSSQGTLFEVTNVAPHKRLKQMTAVKVQFPYPKLLDNLLRSNHMSQGMPVAVCMMVNKIAQALQS